MRHDNKEKNSTRVLFFLILYFCYCVTFHLFKREVNFAFYMLFAFMALAYYLTGFLDFKDRTLRIRDLTYSLVINVFLGVINYSFTHSKREFTVFIILYLISNFLKLILVNINKYEKNVLLVGDYEQADEVANTINQTAGYTCLGLCKVEEIKELRKIILDKKINQIIIFIETIKKEDQSILLELKLSGIEVLTYWKFNEKKEAKIDASHINEEWLLYSNGFDILHDNLQKRAKRFVDLTAALLLALVTLPIMILAAICVKLESKGPIFFKQTRVGLNGIDFTVYKFRSMHLHDENEHSKYSQGNCDKRITFFGKLLRVSRIDELPQLFNVLKGDMSFIGPRPEWDKLGRGYEDQLPYYKIRYLIKPGLTGWAQVMYPYGANLKDTLRKLEYDLYYIKHQNFALDVQIIFKTIKIVLFGKGK